MNISPAHNAPRPSLELQPQGTQASTAVAPAISPNQQQIEIAMRRLFGHCGLPPEDLERLVQTRAARLHQKGEPAQHLRQGRETQHRGHGGDQFPQVGPLR